MADLVILAGVPGVGKTSVSQAAVEGTGYNIVNFGTVIAEMMIKAGIVNHVDEIRAKVKQSDYVKFQLETAKEIVRQDGKVLLTTHMSLQTPFGFYPGLPLDVLQALKPKAIVLLEASHTEIALRHEKDTTRIRGYDFERNIDQYQTFNRMYAVSYSANSGARVKIVHNAQGKMDDAANELKNLLMGL